MRQVDHFKYLSIWVIKKEGIEMHEIKSRQIKRRIGRSMMEMYYVIAVRCELNVEMKRKFNGNGL
jgi:prephenate dehydratase